MTKGDMVFVEGVDMFYLSSTGGKNKTSFTAFLYSLTEAANFKAKYKLRTTPLSLIRCALARPKGRRGIPNLCNRHVVSREWGYNKMRFLNVFFSGWGT